MYRRICPSEGRIAKLGRRHPAACGGSPGDAPAAPASAEASGPGAQPTLTRFRPPGSAAGAGQGGAIQGVTERNQRVEDLQDPGFLQLTDGEAAGADPEGRDAELGRRLSVVDRGADH